MRPALLALFVLSASAGAGAQPDAPPPGWRPLPEALAAAQAERTPTLVYVSASWCGPCLRLRRETFPAPAVADRLRRFALARLDVDDRDRHHRVGPYRLSEAEWAERLGVTAPPGLVVLGPDGALLARHVGFLPPDGLLPILDAALAAVSP